MHCKYDGDKCFADGYSDLNCDDACAGCEYLEGGEHLLNAEAKDSALPPGSVADYADSIVGPIEGYAQSIFAKDKPRYEEILRICIRLREILA